MSRGNAWVITVVAADVCWARATAAVLVREAGIPPRVAARWESVRREMSPAGLSRKLRATRN